MQALAESEKAFADRTRPMYGSGCEREKFRAETNDLKRLLDKERRRHLCAEGSSTLYFCWSRAESDVSAQEADPKR
ncbi:hypothetical protein PILCRDRAFT_128663 [Piloderma croceum F 1598]|uniref:Uncharacterized protein n=1 Tax=Piloderma croceum (strain F 1598) TaxID=765440 RepID=A0A0C3GIF4_PILCF|nr:hypothetical protein PILCRDRAFT_128663 [Piloderma croceum F 1598]